MTDVTAGGEGPAWRIDEVAHRSGLSVDTIRFYQRHGLLAAPRRVGRTSVYGPAHLERLAQIRQLQGSHLSLAAIKSLLDSSRVALADALFAADEGDYTLRQLAEKAALPRDLVEELLAVGLLRDPQRIGRSSYDDADLRLLAAIRGMLETGLPRPFVVRLGEIYALGFARLQGEVLELFTRPGEETPEDLRAVQNTVAHGITPVLHAVESLLAYCHQRTAQTMTVDALRAQGESNPGAGPADGEPLRAPRRGK